MTRTKSSLFPVVLSISLLLLAACSAISPSATSAPPASNAASAISAAEKLAQSFISAMEAEKATDYLALFSDDGIYMDNSNSTMRSEGGDLARNSRSFVDYLFKSTDFDEKFISHFISQDGRFIALTATYTNTGKDGKPASVPVVIILEVKDGKIIREDVYYDSDPYY